ncbi:hypothetical protein B0O80DRAFT_309854 [Mortierella sp. GBAus27b]|nr:hypothetical protein B0O80DRAFT_309854 [Mortierella sp. GBAus27b]
MVPRSKCDLKPPAHNSCSSRHTTLDQPSSSSPAPLIVSTQLLLKYKTQASATCTPGAVLMPTPPAAWSSAEECSGQIG